MRLLKVSGLLLSLLLLAHTAGASGQDRGPGVRCARLKAGARRPPKPRPAAGPEKNLGSLVEGLRAAGLKAERSGEMVSQPFFSVEGQTITVEGEQVQVFEFATAREAEARAKLVDASGSSVGTSKMAWMAPPHFYRGGRMIVLYVGDNRSVTGALTGLLGPQFAGQ